MGSIAAGDAVPDVWDGHRGIVTQGEGTGPSKKPRLAAARAPAPFAEQDPGAQGVLDVKIQTRGEPPYSASLRMTRRLAEFVTGPRNASLRQLEKSFCVSVSVEAVGEDDVWLRISEPEKVPPVPKVEHAVITIVSTVNVYQLLSKFQEEGGGMMDPEKFHLIGGVQFHYESACSHAGGDRPRKKAKAFLPLGGPFSFLERRDFADSTVQSGTGPDWAPGVECEHAVIQAVHLVRNRADLGASARAAGRAAEAAKQVAAAVNKPVAEGHAASAAARAAVVAAAKAAGGEPVMDPAEAAAAAVRAAEEAAAKAEAAEHARHLRDI